MMEISKLKTGNVCNLWSRNRSFMGQDKNPIYWINIKVRTEYLCIVHWLDRIMMEYATFYIEGQFMYKK